MTREDKFIFVGCIIASIAFGMTADMVYQVRKTKHD